MGSKILLVNQEKSRWSAHVKITSRSDEFGGFNIEIIDKFGTEEPKHIITLEAHHSQAKKLIYLLIDALTI